MVKKGKGWGAFFLTLPRDERSVMRFNENYGVYIYISIYTLGCPTAQ